MFMLRSKTTPEPLAPQGILPNNQVYWTKINQVISNLANAYGFERLELPIAEKEDLFIKKLKDYDDIADKGMYSLESGENSRMSLRPNFTPSIIRAYLESHSPAPSWPARLHTIGPLFYHNSDKSPWLNQIYHANFEIIGEKDPVIDAQLIQILFSIGRELGLKNLIAKINSVGCPSCRSGYQKSLANFYRRYENDLCGQCQEQLTAGWPLRILTCSEPVCSQLVQDAPRIFDYLCSECHNHLRDVLEFLDEVSIPYMLAPHLFKMSNCYTKTVFEILPEDNLTAEALAVGCRHDNLIAALGGESAPAIGVDVRLNNLFNLMEERKVKVNQRLHPLVFLVQLGNLGKKRSMILFERMRRSGLRVASSVACSTMTAQLRAANQLGAQFVLILGQKEALDDTIIIRDIYSGIQETVPLEKIIKEIKKRIKLNK